MSAITDRDRYRFGVFVRKHWSVITVSNRSDMWDDDGYDDPIETACWLAWKEATLKAREDFRIQSKANSAAISALAMMYDKWECGDECYEEPDTFSGFLGRAFCLTEKEEDRVLEIIGKERSGLASPESAETEELRSEILALREQVASLESREVCTVAHDGVDTCGYCQRDDIRITLAELNAEKQTLDIVRIALLEALTSVRIFVQDCIENSFERAALANLYAARDAIDAAIAIAKEPPHGP